MPKTEHMGMAEISMGDDTCKCVFSTPADPDGPGLNRLTCIHQRIHCPATQDTLDENDELEEIQIAAFLNTLAEVALSFAKRKEQLGD